MGLAAMIIGIVAVVLGIIPGCGLVFGLPPAIVGLILGIVDVKKKSKAKQPKGMGMAGVVLNAVAIVFIILWTLVFATATVVTRPMIEDINVPSIERSIDE
ncbi:unnamed protein product [marine sediment metagenome]|uniref:DUF4190 domain-containing protein n=1 Tax=marine sediment metagenome TaxID=412755 RepID=X0WMV6_9ZZZZ